MLTQNTVYEIPALKKHNQKLEQVQQECDKKEETAGNRILELEEEFRWDFFLSPLTTLRYFEA